MLIKTKDIGIKTRTDLIYYMYAKQAREGKKQNKLFEVNNEIVL